MGAQETGSEAGLGVPCVYQDPHLWKEGRGARMAQEKTKATGTMKYIFHTRASCIRPTRLNSLCCLVSGQGLSVPGRLCFRTRLILQPSPTLREVTVEAACWPSFVSSKVTPEKGWSTSTFSTLYRSEGEEFILQLMCLFLSKNSRHPAPH